MIIDLPYDDFLRFCSNKWRGKWQNVSYNVLTHNTCWFRKVMIIYDHINTCTLLHCVSKPLALKQIVRYHAIDFMHLTHLASQIDGMYLTYFASQLSNCPCSPDQLVSSPCLVYIPLLFDVSMFEIGTTLIIHIARSWLHACVCFCIAFNSRTKTDQLRLPFDQTRTPTLI